jgi:AraC-like DNA-binding protein
MSTQVNPRSSARPGSFAEQIPYCPIRTVSCVGRACFPRSLLPGRVRDLGRMDELSPSDTARLSTLMVNLLTAALDNALDAQRGAPPQTRRRALMTQIHAFVKKNLGDADLTPNVIAAAHHISLRYLHKLFQQEGHTVAGWIRERRLEQCRRDLANPHLAARPINAIAAQWGFANPAHFSHAFRKAYGLSPRKYRQQCMAVRSDQRKVCAHQ